MSSPSMFIKGIHEPDDKYRAMKAVYDACKKAHINLPDEVGEFFGWQEPSDLGNTIDLGLHAATYNYCDGKGREGFEVKLADLPKNITHIRFYLHW